MKIFLQFVCAGLLGWAFTSCGEDAKYSCDPDLDSWVKSNMEEIKTLTRQDFLKLSHDNQIAAYAAMGQHQRESIWREKLQQIISLEWDEEERNHLTDLLAYLDETPYFFAETNTLDQEDAVTIFLYKWQDYAIRELEWDKQTVYAICGSPHEAVINRKDGKLEVSLINIPPRKNHFEIIKTRSESPSGGSDCGCSRDSDYCDIWGELTGVVTCRSHNCEVRIRACGLFLRFDCDGVCKGIGV